MTAIPKRFYDPEQPELWGCMPPEIWTMVLDCLRLYEKKGLVATSKWFRNLYWDNRKVYNISTPVKYDIPKILNEKETETAIEKVCKIIDLSSSNAFTILKVYHVPLGDEIIKHLVMSCFPSKIQTLHLEGCDITGKSMPYISQLSSLRYFTIIDNDIRDIDMVYITNLTLLKEIVIDDCHISDLTILYLSGLYNLVKCSLMYNHCRVHTKDISNPTSHIDSLGDCCFHGFANKDLVSLTFKAYSPVTFKGLRYINTKSLKTLKIEFSNFLNSDAIEYISNIKTLEKLYLQINDTEIKYSSLSKLINLKKLGLENTMVTNQDLLALSVIQLDSLNISFCRLITDFGLDNYMDVRPKNIRYIKISGCTSLTAYYLYDCLIFDGYSWRIRPANNMI